jgi:hypothetical protein
MPINFYNGPNPMLVSTAGTGVILAASAIVKTGEGILTRILASASTSLVISVYDGLDDTAAGLRIDSLACAAGVNQEVGLLCSTGIYVKVVSGSGKFTVIYT